MTALTVPLQGVHTVAEVRDAEQALMETLPPHELMHRAAFALAVHTAHLLREHFGSVTGMTVVGLIGVGNNGSDTLWALALLAARGVKVQAVAATGQRTGDHTDELFHKAGGRWVSLDDCEDAQLYLDGIAGLGSSRPVNSDVVTTLRLRQQAGALVVAVDLPSGLVADTAIEVETGGVIAADVTVTFGCLKPCHVLDPGLEFCGEVRVVDLGLLPFLPRARTHSADDLSAAWLWPIPEAADSKYTRGVVNIVAGSKKYPGAGLLAARAARWGGAGMVRHVGVGAVFEPESPSLVVQPDLLIGDWADAYVVGPGLGVGKQSRKVVKAALKTPTAVVLDAGALNLLAADEKLQQRLRDRSGLTVLTPHGGEFARLLKGYGIEASASPADTAVELAAASGAVVYLKGSIGVIATPGGEIVATRRTSEHLATAGSGDVLAGLLGSLMAATRPNSEWSLALVCAAAVIAHSYAAELIAEDGEPVTAESLEENLPLAVADLLEEL